MDKSVLVKIVWLGAIAAIPTAVLALQKPKVHVPVEARRVITMDQPVAVDIRSGEMQSSRHMEPAPSAEPVRPAQPLWMTGATIKAGSSAPSASTPQAQPAPPTAPTVALTPPPAPPKQSMASTVAPGRGPQ
ncbi:MAG TPA: hypothetical protein VJT73_10950 [Polyangiaceae bacterium]|nr:hypothetical protein [Polyangiaceae bacterium]